MLIREHVAKCVDEYIGTTDEDVQRMDSLDYIELMMFLEDDFAILLPDQPRDLTPPPPYRSRDELIDAFIASMKRADECPSGSTESVNTNLKR